MRAKDVRKGNVIIFKDVPHRVADFTHRTPGNLRAFVQVKLRNLMNGALMETRFSSDEDLQLADMFSYKASYLYGDDTGYTFMNVDTYEQVTLNDEIIGDSRYYLMDGITVEIMTWEERPIGVTLPKTVELTVTDTTPEMRGATASNSPKPATTHTGLQVSVPPFVKIGDRIVVDTEDGSYLSRAD